jgi:hypothetical protein
MRWLGKRLPTGRGLRTTSLNVENSRTPWSETTVGVLTVSFFVPAITVTAKEVEKLFLRLGRSLDILSRTLYTIYSRGT